VWTALLGTADEVWMPLSPRLLLVLTPHDVGPERVIQGTAETAATVNYRLAQEAYENVYMHPHHDVLPSKMPAFAPLFAVSGRPDDALL